MRTIIIKDPFTIDQIYLMINKIVGQIKNTNRYQWQFCSTRNKDSTQNTRREGTRF